MADPFAIPPVTPKTTRVIRAASAYTHDRMRGQSDARDIIKGLVRHHGAALSYPGYRTALRCGGIYTEAAASCDLAVAKILLSSFAEKAAAYLHGSGESDLFAGVADACADQWGGYAQQQIRRSA